MRTLFSALLLLSCSVTAWVSHADETTSRTRQPSKDDAEILQRFVEECVAIKPGSDSFPGKFVIGEKAPTKNEVPQQEVTLTVPFRVSRYEVTQELYMAVSGSNPSRWRGLRNSVENVSWDEAVAFCDTLTSRLRSRKLIGLDEVVRLPTSIEWEYCCRAGTSTRYSFGADPGKDGATDVLDEHAWHTGNAAGNDPAVGVLKPNAWGLFDFHGYLWEFVADEPPADEKRSQPERMIRGGSWKDHHSLLSSSTYLTIAQGVKDDGIGFRCVIAQDLAVKNRAEQ